MDRAQDYIVDSLEQHLFFARIMKEHAFFLKVGLLPPNAGLADEGEQLLRQFEDLLSRTIALSDGVVGSRVLDSGEVVTEFTDCAERQTQRLTGTRLDCGLTARAMGLRSRDCGQELCVSSALADRVQELNRDGIQLVDRLIRFKERILRGVHSCGLFTVNYPMLIEHILREARLYRAHLMRLERPGDCGCDALRDSELFWNRIMMSTPCLFAVCSTPRKRNLLILPTSLQKTISVCSVPRRRPATGFCAITIPLPLPKNFGISNRRALRGSRPAESAPSFFRCWPITFCGKPTTIFVSCRRNPFQLPALRADRAAADHASAAAF